MSRRKVYIVFLFVFLLISAFAISYADDEEERLPVQFRMIRVYGGDDEREPPVIILESDQKTITPAFSSSQITIEFDVDAPVPPSLFAKFVHCDINWNEDENVFLNDMAFNRTSNIKWEKAPVSSNYYAYRGFVKVPDIQVKFKFPGNWKVQFYSYDDDEKLLAEARFFVVEPKAYCRIDTYSETYEPDLKVSPAAYSLEAVVSTRAQLFDTRLSTVVIYRKHRWFEPLVISTDKMVNTRPELYKYNYRRTVGGFAAAEKRFRIDRVPAENEYRVLNLTNTAQYPGSYAPIRMPFSDLRRLGSNSEADDDGAMITSFISHSDDDYITLEFLLDPDGFISEDDVFVVGSFNSWKPDPSWQMFYDEEEKSYKLRQRVRRARHNYMYATGRLNFDTKEVTRLSYEAFEGNNSFNDNTFIAFVYYRETDYGGYDSIIGVGAGSLMGTFRR